MIPWQIYADYLEDRMDTRLFRIAEPKIDFEINQATYNASSDEEESSEIHYRCGNGYGSYDNGNGMGQGNYKFSVGISGDGKGSSVYGYNSGNGYGWSKYYKLVAGL